MSRFSITNKRTVVELIIVVVLFVSIVCVSFFYKATYDFVFYERACDNLFGYSFDKLNDNRLPIYDDIGDLRGCFSREDEEMVCLTVNEEQRKKIMNSEWLTDFDVNSRINVSKDRRQVTVTGYRETVDYDVNIIMDDLIYRLQFADIMQYYGNISNLSIDFIFVDGVTGEVKYETSFVYKKGFRFDVHADEFSSIWDATE